MRASAIRGSISLALALILPACGGGGNGGPPKTVTAPTVVLVTPVGDQTGNVVVSYQLCDAESDTCSIAVSYSLNGGATWLPAKVGPGGDGVAGLSASPLP